jgi:hypothetical protein
MFDSARSGGHETVVCGKPASIRTVHCSRKSDTARRGGIAGNSENGSPPNRTAGPRPASAVGEHVSGLPARALRWKFRESRPPRSKFTPSEPPVGVGRGAARSSWATISVLVTEDAGKADRQSKTDVRAVILSFVAAGPEDAFWVSYPKNKDG